MLSYAFYNNKGGVGKTTLCFNVSSIYASKNKTTQVLVIDMCPQANVSQYLLGGGRVGFERCTALQNSPHRISIAGFVDWLLKGNSGFHKKPEHSFSVRVSDYNKKITSNLFLVPGDPLLESFSIALNYSVLSPANLNAWKEFMVAIRRLAEAEFDHNHYDEMVVFIDCNPSFSIYTQMALLSSDRLVIPMMADFTSIEGIKGIFNLLYGKYISSSSSDFTRNILTFPKLVKDNELPLPKIFEFVFNNYTANRGIATAYDSIRGELIDSCYSHYNKYPELFFPAEGSIQSGIDLQNFYVSDIKDFHTAGKVSASLGIPIPKLVQQSTYTMPDTEVVQLPSTNYKTSVDEIKKLVSRFE